MRPSSIKEMSKMGILKIFRRFSKIYKREER